MENQYIQYQGCSMFKTELEDLFTKMINKNNDKTGGGLVSKKLIKDIIKELIKLL